MAETYVKICGLRTPEAVAAAVDAGADAIGFVFAPGGPRTVSAELARSLGEAVPAEIETVGVFRNQPIGEVIETARAAAVSTVQLHGDEPLSDLRLLEDAGFRTLRAFSAEAYSALPEDEKADWETGRILLDAVEPGAGVTFDRERHPGAAAARALAAGRRADPGQRRHADCHAPAARRGRLQRR